MSAGPGEDTTPERVKDSDAIKALARVVNTGGDAEAQELLEAYVAQEDEADPAPTSAEYSYFGDGTDTPSSTDSDASGDDDGADVDGSGKTAAGRRAKP